MSFFLTPFSFIIICRISIGTEHGGGNLQYGPRLNLGKATALLTSAEHYGGLINLDFNYTRYCPALSRRLCALSGSHSKYFLYGTFVWVRGALNGPFRRFSARAVDALAAQNFTLTQVRRGWPCPCSRAL
jgi:hypothetical protein